MHLTVSHPLRPRRRSLNTARVAASFGLDVDPADRLTIAEDLPVHAGPGRVTLFTGPSGSGKSTLLRTAAESLEADGVRVVRADALTLPDRPLADALPLGFDAACTLLSKCGLAEPRLLLRTPAELSEGQRFRFRLALAVCEAGGGSDDGGDLGVVVCDEFAAVLDRTLAAAVAHNVRRLCAATGVGFLLATTHEDVAADLAPHHAVRCRSGGPPVSDAAPDRAPADPHAGRTPLGPLFPDGPDVSPGRVSFAKDLFLTTASRGDWAAFAGWHYRAHTVGIVRFGVLLWHGSRREVSAKTVERQAEPVGIALFCSAPLSLRGRNVYFGTGSRWTSAGMKAMNAQLVTLSRVVLHPTYRGCSLAAPFVAAACDACPFPWVESLTQLGHTHPFLERAGFVKVPVGPPRRGGRRSDQSTLRQHSAIYGAGGKGRVKTTLSAASHAKSRHAAPAYFIRDNRAAPAVLEANRREKGDRDE